jgi:hypothetical protein
MARNAPTHRNPAPEPIPSLDGLERALIVLVAIGLASFSGLVWASGGPTLGNALLYFLLLTLGALFCLRLGATCLREAIAEGADGFQRTGWGLLAAAMIGAGLVSIFRLALLAAGSLA